MKKIVICILFAFLCFWLSSCAVYTTDDCYTSGSNYTSHYVYYYRPAPTHYHRPHPKPAPHRHHTAPHYHKPKPNPHYHKPHHTTRPQTHRPHNNSIHNHKPNRH